MGRKEKRTKGKDQTLGGEGSDGLEASRDDDTIRRRKRDPFMFKESTPPFLVLFFFHSFSIW